MDQRVLEEKGPLEVQVNPKTKIVSPRIRPTRRNRKIDSSEECVLPSSIPRSQTFELITFQSYQRDETHLILQIPIGLFTLDTFSLPTSLRVESKQLQIVVSKDIMQVIFIGLGGEAQQEIYSIWGKYSYLSAKEMQNKLIKISRRRAGTEISSFKVKDVDSDVFLILNLRREPQLCGLHMGLVNQGNTCYMNSYLQMLFHVGEFRRLVYEAPIKDETKFPATLQMLFYKLENEEKAVSSEQLIKSFGWSKKEVLVQQDAQEFSCLFFEVLERKLGQRKGISFGREALSMEALFEGELAHYIECPQIRKLGLTNDLNTSLDEYISQQMLEGDNMYRTEHDGLQKAVKGVRISKLPPILMIQLKRFQFNPFTQANEKLMGKFTYPEHIDFTRWRLQEKEDGEKKETDLDGNQGSSNEYSLYGVLVHEGLHASSGHYYAYLHLNDHWYKFNDECVEEASRQNVFTHNFGGTTQILQYDTKEMKIEQRITQNKPTAYMLVYMRNSMKSKLMESTVTYPPWLLSSNATKMEVEEERKIRKLSICDVKIIHFRELVGQQCGLNFISKDLYDRGRIIPLLNKSESMEKWVKQIANQEGSVCLHWFHNEKEVVVSSHSRQYSTVGDFFKEGIDPMLLLVPLKIKQDQFLIVVKLYKSDSFIIDNCLKINKTARMNELHALLLTIYPHSCPYIEERKNGLIKIDPGSISLLPVAQPNRSQLLLIVIDSSVENDVQEWYRRERSLSSVLLKNERSKEFHECDLSQDMTVRELREFIFKDILQQDQQYIASSNIVIKSKPKKSSKVFQEAAAEEKLGGMIKHDRTILFDFSSLNAEERVSQKELSVYYRDRAFRFSEQLKLVVGKEEGNVMDKIANHEDILTKRKEQGMEGVRVMLFSKDRMYINDVVDAKGYIPGKGELLNVINREKSIFIVVEGVMEPNQYKNGVNEEIISVSTPSDTLTVLLHHISKGNQRCGNPRCFDVSKTMKLVDLRMMVLELIEKDTIDWEGKTNQISIMKVRVLGYTKDITKAIDLPEEECIECISEAQGQEQKKPQKSVKDEAMVEMEGGSQCVGNGKVEANKDDGPPVETPLVNLQEVVIDWRLRTIEEQFGKCKILRVVVMNLLLARNVQPLKLNVE